MPVAQHDTAPINPNARRNIFGAHSPICHDELSPEKRVAEVNSSNRPASRARGRVISTEDAMQATNAVLDPYEMPAPETSHPSMSLMSPPPTSLTATPTPSLPLLSPQCVDGRASTVTTPSLPSLSPAMPLLSRHSTPLPHSPCLPDLSPQEHRQLPRRPEGILPRRSQTATPSSSLSSPTPSVETSNIPPPLPVSQRLSIDIPTDPALQPTKPTSPPSRQEEATPESQGSSALPVQVATTPADTKTGRKMRDCRKFIHYEFSPPFMSSESSQSEVEVTEGEGEGLRKMTKRRGRPRKTLSMEEKPREESPTKEVSQQQQQQKKRGRKPMKSKSTDDTMLQTTTSAPTTGESGWPQVKAKRKRGRPPKNPQDSSSMSVSQMASKLEDSHVQSRSQIISQQRQSLLSRRSSEGSETKRLEKEPAQLRQERSHSFDTVDGIDQLTRQLLESHPQLLLKAPPNSTAKPEKEVSRKHNLGTSYLLRIFIFFLLVFQTL